MQNSDVVKAVNNLITVLKDADEGLHAAAMEVRDTDLRTELHSFGQQCATMWGELQAEVRQLGGEPQEEGSFSGKCARVWMEIKTAFSDKDEYIVLGDCVKAQQSVVDEFQDVVRTAEMPSNVKSAVSRHLGKATEINGKLTEHYERFKKVQA